MKTGLRLWFMLVCLIYTLSVHAQFVRQWDQGYGGTSDEWSFTTLQTADGGYLMSGYTNSPSSPTDDITDNSRGLTDYWVVKLDENGQKQWDRRFGGSSDEYGNRMIQTADGGYLLGGISASGISGDVTQSLIGQFDIWIVKIDALGNKLWDKRYGGDNFETFETIIATPDGGFLIGGDSFSNISGTKTQNNYSSSRDFWIIKMDASGNQLWDRRYGSAAEERLEVALTTSDGGYILAGTTNSTTTNGDITQAGWGAEDFWVIKIDALGNKLWDKRYGGSNNDRLKVAIQASDNTLYFGGISSSNISGSKTQNTYGGEDYWLVKTDGSGNILWDKDYGGGSTDYLAKILQTSTNEFLLGGITNSAAGFDISQSNLGLHDYWILKIDGNGNKIINHRLGSSSDEFLLDFIRTTDGNYVLSGSSDGNISGDKTQSGRGGVDYWIIKVTSENYFPATAVADGFNTNRGMALTGNVRINDLNPGNNTLTTALVSGPANGYLSLNAVDGSFTYTPNAGFTGSDSFTYRSCDNTRTWSCSQATVTINVTAFNQAPVAANDSYQTNEDTPLTIAAPGVLSNDTDANNDALTAMLHNTTSHGTLMLNANGSFIYTPNLNFNGTDSFTYRASDGLANSSITTVTITVNPVNDAPVFVKGANQTALMNAGEQTINGWATSIDDGDPELTQVLTFTTSNNNNALFLVQPSVSATGTLTYTPAIGMTGTVTVSMFLSDNGSGVAPNVNQSAIQIFTITINPITGPTGCSGSAGLMAEYYPSDGSASGFSDNQSFFTTYSPTYTRIDGPLDFDNNFYGGNNVPIAGSDPINFAARYRGSIAITTPGTYTFYLSSDDASYLWIDNDALSAPAVTSKALIQNGGLHRALTRQASINLTTGLHNLLIHYGQSGGDSNLRLEYAGPGITRQVVPVNVLCTTLQPTIANLPVSVVYAPNALYTMVGNAASSTVPTVNNGGSPITQYMITNGASLPDGISIGATGVITADGTVPAGNYTVNLALSNANGTRLFNNILQIYVVPSGCNGSDAGGNPAAGGLYAEYYNGYFEDNQSFFTSNTPTFITIESPIDYWGNLIYPDSELFSIRYRGRIYVPTTGTYTFYLTSDDASYLWIGNTAVATPVQTSQALINNGGPHGPDLVEASINLTAGYHTLLIHYGRWYGNGVLTLEYAGPGISRQVVPPSALCSSIQANQAPVAVNDAYSTNEDTPLSIAAPGVLTNDTDLENSPLTAALVSNVSNGTLTLNANGSFTYTPNLNFSGTDSFTYQVCEGTSTSACGQGVVTITVNAVNDAPVAVNDSYNTNEDTPLTITAPGVLANDTDVDNTTLTSVLVNGPANGSLSLNANGSFTYTPNPNYNGTDSFTYRANDGALNSPIATVTITVNPVNDAPVALNDAYITNEDTPLVLNVLSNDSGLDAGLNPGSVTVVTPPGKGSVAINSVTGAITYTPNANVNGTDSFTYQVRDVNGTLSNVATVTITITPVNDVPVAMNDNVSTPQNTALTIIAPGVLSNDTDVENNLLTAALVSPTTNGSLTLNANGSFTYTPNLNFNGTDSFTYRANDGTDYSNVATVTITVTAVNQAPVAVNDAYSTNEDTPLTIAAPGVLTNDTDIENSPLTAVLVSGPANGTLQFQSDGGFIYTPNLNFSGIDSFVYRANDGVLNSANATVTITINAINDAPVAVNDSYTTNEDIPLTITAPGVLTNDTDIENSPLTAVLVSGPVNGQLQFQSNGSFTYTPNLNFSGTDSFTYRANDGVLNSANATVTITINAVNDAPMAVNDAYTTNEDTPLTIAAPGVLANDTDVDNDPLSAILVTPVSNGTLTLNANGSFTYTPAANFSGSDSFTYRANDGSLNSNVATVTITINAVNDAPVVVNDSYTTNKDTPLTITAPGVLTNDNDGENSPLTAILVNGPANGTLSLNANGGFTYTPNLNFSGTDSFTYQANDGSLNSAVAAVTITVNPATGNPVNKAPILTGATVEIMQGTMLNGSSVLVSATDPESDPLQVTTTPVTGPTNGTLVLNTDGTYVYTPNKGFFGTDQFTYQICDNQSACSQATITIQVKRLNNPIVYEGISPNGDNRNDTWYIEDIDLYPQNRVSIFNRWGNLVYEVRGYDNTSQVWSGQSNQGLRIGGDMLPSGTYFYVLDLGNGTPVQKGKVVLSR